MEPVHRIFLPKMWNINCLQNFKDNFKSNTTSVIKTEWKVLKSFIVKLSSFNDVDNFGRQWKRPFYESAGWLVVLSYLKFGLFLLYTYIYIYIYIYIFIYIYILCICVCVYIYVYIYKIVDKVCYHNFQDIQYGKALSYVYLCDH